MDNYQKYGLIGIGIFLWLALANFSKLISQILESLLIQTNLNAFLIEGVAEYSSLILTLLIFLAFLRKLRKINFEEKKQFKKILSLSLLVVVTTSVLLGFYDSLEYLILNQLLAKVEYSKNLQNYSTARLWSIITPMIILKLLIYPILIFGLLKTENVKKRGTIIIGSLSLLMLAFIIACNSYISDYPTGDSFSELLKTEELEKDSVQLQIKEGEVIQKLDFETGDILIEGTFFDYESNQKINNVTLELFKDGDIVGTQEINTNGTLKMNLEYGFTYTLNFKKEGFNSKKLVVSTLNIPDEEKEIGGFEVPFTMSLQKDDVKSLSTEVPIGIFKYDVEEKNLVYDPGYTEFLKSIF